MVVIEPSIVVINYFGNNPHFNKEIWEAHGSPLNLALGDGWSSIHDFTFMDTKLEKIKIPTSITYIGHSAFENAEKLKSVIFNPGSQLKVIGESAFKNAKALTTIEIPSGVETIPFGAFQGTKNLISVKFDIEHSQLKTIEAAAFNYTGLYSIKLPKGVTQISSYAFFDNNNLNEIYIYPNVLETLNADEFNGRGHFGMNNFDDNNMFLGLNHPVNIISMEDTTQGGRRNSKSKPRTRKLVTRRQRRHKNKSKRRRTIKSK